jgi:retron-type reverse transcriptase
VAKQQPERRFALLDDKVCRQDILQEAWQRVQSNKGAPGGDEAEIDEIREYGEARFLSEIEQELRDDSYRVSGVRRVHIPKSGQPGKTRPLGIPTVKDRVLRLIRAWLKAGVVEEGKVTHPDRGTPQGGVVSAAFQHRST